VVGVARRQVMDLPAPPAPQVTEYQVITRACPACASHSSASAPGCAPARVQDGPRTLARTAELVCAHCLPVARAAHLMRPMPGVRVPTGLVASLRHRAAPLLEPTFLPRVRQLLRWAGVLHVDESPGRAAGGLEYVHIAATGFLTARHTPRAQRRRHRRRGHPARIELVRISV
jgi:transposase